MDMSQNLVTIAAGGTPQNLGVDKKHAWAFSIQAHWDNANPVYVGKSDMVKATGEGVIRRLNAEETMELANHSGVGFDINSLYFDGETGEKLLVSFWRL